MTAWLLTWLWQGSALAATVAFALRVAPRHNAATRHAIWYAALAGIAWLGWASSPAQAVVSATVPVTETIYIPQAPDLLATILASIWAAITLVGLLRVLPGLHAIFTLRDRCRAFPPAVERQLSLWLGVREIGRRTQLMICDDVSGATVLGFYRPCIAVPPSLVDALTVDELDQVILHEYAHVQRRDDWAQLAQRLLLSVLWMHPAALFISRALSREREMACDEWVVSRTRQPKAYARCLVHAAELRARRKNNSALQPTLIGRRHELVRRVDRVLAINHGDGRGASLAAAAAASCAMLMLSVPLRTVRFVEMAEVIFPAVVGPRIVAGVRLKPDPTYDEGPYAGVRLKPDTTHAAAHAAAYAAKNDATGEGTHSAKYDAEPEAEPVALGIPSRAFAGVYASAAASMTSTGDPQNRWMAVANPAVEIAAAAKKTSIRVANGFSRAGTSLAQRF